MRLTLGFPGSRLGAGEESEAFSDTPSPEPEAGLAA